MVLVSIIQLATQKTYWEYRYKLSIEALKFENIISFLVLLNHTTILKTYLLNTYLKHNSLYDNVISIIT